MSAEGAMTPEEIRAAADRIAAAGDSKPRLARDPVNRPAIRNWLEAISGAGGTVPGGTASGGAASGGTVPGGAGAPDTAPPAMIQVWTMPGLHGAREGDDPLGAMVALLDEAGYPAVIATNCEQAYLREVRVGEQLAVSARLLDVTGPKRTALGEGWFVTTRSTWTVDGEPVATMDFRVLKYRVPPGAEPPVDPRHRGGDPPVIPLPRGTSTDRSPLGLPAAGPGETRPSASTSGNPAGQAVMRPVSSPDTAFFWAGTAAGELRVQACDSCGARRHPPGPRCPACGAMATGSYVVAAGTGEVYSYVVHHRPPVPGKRLPIVIALVELPEGVRMTGELLGVAPDQVRIGLPVRAAFTRIDDDLTLPAWRDAARATLPPRVIDVTPTFVVASALATRDFQDVHHDRDRAIAGGARDIFLNILTTAGLVQQYVAAWAGPGQSFRAMSIRLGAPCHAGDTLTLTGEVTSIAGTADGTERVIAVTGRCGPGDHVTATVRLAAPDSLGGPEVGKG
jgi:uncharacterized OB-fold protein/acyl dehydratase